MWIVRIEFPMQFELNCETSNELTAAMRIRGQMCAVVAVVGYVFLPLKANYENSRITIYGRNVRKATSFHQNFLEL